MAPDSPDRPRGRQPWSRRVAFLAALAGILVLSGFLVRHWWFSLPVGQGPAGPSVDSAAFTGTWTTRPVLVVGLGDSITFGFGAPKGYGYFSRLLTNPPGEFADMRGLCLSRVLPNLRSTNLAVSGSVSRDCQEHQLGLLPISDTNVLGLVMITTGGNDLIHNYGKTPPRELAMYGASLEQAQPWTRNYEERLDKIIRGVERPFPGRVPDLPGEYLRSDRRRG